MRKQRACDRHPRHTALCLELLCPVVFPFALAVYLFSLSLSLSSPYLTLFFPPCVFSLHFPMLSPIPFARFLSLLFLPPFARFCLPLALFFSSPPSPLRSLSCCALCASGFAPAWRTVRFEFGVACSLLLRFPCARHFRCVLSLFFLFLVC